MKTAAISSILKGPPLREQVSIEENSPVDSWNDYVSRPPGSLFHRAEWEQVFAVYGLQFRRLATVRDGRVTGVLPLVWQRSLLFGNQFVSLPCFDATGVLADESQSRSTLVDKAARLASDAGAKVVLVRQLEPFDLSPHVRTDKVLMRRILPRDPGELWHDLAPKVRNQVRKPQKQGLAVERGGRELLPNFFAVYSENMRDLGSPSHSRRFFQTLFDAFPREAAIYVVRLDGNVVATGLTMANGDRLEIPWASSLRRYNSYCVNHLMYWKILEDACQSGFCWFHFGRSSRGSGTFRFKRQWGAEPVQLHWYYIPLTAKGAAQAISMQESYGWGAKLWKRLPLWLTRSIGPQIISKVP